MKQYDFMEVIPSDGDYYVSDERLNKFGHEGWSVAYTFFENRIVMMQREIVEKPHSMFNSDTDGDIQ